MRFTRQFPVYYCCVLVVPDKINQCLWIIAGEARRCRSAAECPAERLSAPAICTMDSENCPKQPRYGSGGLAEGWFFFGGGYNTWVLWSLICGGSAAAGAGVRTLSCPKLNFHWKIEEANMPRARRWTLSFLLLSFNRIKLLIILWTGLRPYFNLSWRAGEIRERGRCFGPPQLSRALARCRLLFHYNTRAPLTADLPFQPPCTRAHARNRRGE